MTSQKVQVTMTNKNILVNRHLFFCSTITICGLRFLNVAFSVFTFYFFPGTSNICTLSEHIFGMFLVSRPLDPGYWPLDS